MADVRIIDVHDAATFALLPPCADPSFDHRTCDYWEDTERGSKAHRAAWLDAAGSGRAGASGPPVPGAIPFNPFAPQPKAPAPNPFALDDDTEPLADNPFAPARPRVVAPTGGPRKLALLCRGLAVFGSYAKVLLVGDEPAAYAQFGPLSAYPRALRTRELYPSLPEAPLPAVITCVATTGDARGGDLGHLLVTAVCEDLAGRGFAAVEAYPEVGARPDATSAATPAFWIEAGFAVAAADDRFPVLRRELE